MNPFTVLRKPLAMTADKLKVGDRIRILDIPGRGRPDYYLHRDTRRAYRKIIARNRPVRISRIEHGAPWFDAQFRLKDGRIEYHSFVVDDGDENWELVTSSRRRSK